MVLFGLNIFYFQCTNLTLLAIKVTKGQNHRNNLPVRDTLPQDRRVSETFWREIYSSPLDNKLEFRFTNDFTSVPGITKSSFIIK